MHPYGHQKGEKERHRYADHAIRFIFIPPWFLHLNSFWPYEKPLSFAWQFVATGRFRVSQFTRSRHLFPAKPNPILPQRDTWWGPCQKYRICMVMANPVHAWPGATCLWLPSKIKSNLCLVQLRYILNPLHCCQALQDRVIHQVASRILHEHSSRRNNLAVFCKCTDNTWAPNGQQHLQVRLQVRNQQRNNPQCALHFDASRHQMTNCVLRSQTLTHRLVEHTYTHAHTHAPRGLGSTRTKTQSQTKL